MFIGRKAELKTLTEAYQTPGFQMTVIYGRRRIGKSTLIQEFIKDKKAVYYTAVQANITRNLELWSRQIFDVLSPEIRGMSFSSAEDLLMFLYERCREERTVIVIDELPWLAESDRSILSVLQSFIDHYWKQSEIFLILCGSSVSFMENEVLSEKSPLFGRRNSQIRLEPFSYPEVAEFVPSYSYEDKAVCYGVTGGVAKYLSLFDDSKSLEENIITQFFTKSGYLYEETTNLLAQEFRNISTYNDIIHAISEGANKLNEIADKTHLNNTTVSHAIFNLIATGIVVKENAMTDEANRKKVQYRLKDNMFKFWYQFIPDGSGAIEMGQGDVYYRKAVKPRLHEYMGNVFEEMCRFYTLKAGLAGNLSCFVTAVGKWWGTDPKKREQTDMDVVGLDKLAKKAVIGECKFKKEKLGKEVYEKLLEKRDLLDRSYRIEQYLLFSLGGFTDWVRENADEDRVKLVELKDMYEADKS